MKINCRTCDICGDQMGSRDFQYWLRKPLVKWGYPEIGMPRMDICDTCFAKVTVMIQHPELFKWEEETTDENPC